MKTKRLYTAPAMKLVAVETEQMMQGSQADYNGAKTISIIEEESSEAGAAKRSSLWDDEDE